MQNETYTDVYSFLRSVQEEEARKQEQEEFINGSNGDAWLKYARYALSTLAEEHGVSREEMRDRLAMSALICLPEEAE